MPSDATAPVAPARPRKQEGYFWSVYDALGADLDPAVRIEAFAAGMHWFGVRAAGSVGFAMAPRDSHDSPSRAGRIAGAPLVDIAPLARSWNFADAALGIAALNSHYNRPDRVLGWAQAPFFVHQTGANAFETLRPRLAGRRVAVVGHFRGLEELAKICQLTILERRPQPGDAPDPACEVVLPESDFVFITATTLINKTLPRLLQLCRGAFVTIVGPTTPLTPLWFELGVDMIAGLLIDDVPAVWAIVQEGGQHTFFDHGTRMIQIERSRGDDSWRKDLP